METTEGRIKVLGYRLFYRTFGEPDKGTLLALHGGPGNSHGYLLPLADLAQFGYRIVLYDQIGCGGSDRPRGAKYYTQSRAVEEVEGVRRALNLGRVHLFGSSYGGALSLDVALRHPRSLRSLVLASGLANFALWESEQARLFSRLPRATRTAITKAAARGGWQNPKYVTAIDPWFRKHYCRLRVWPYDLRREYDMLAQHHLNVPHDGIEDRLKGWDITDHLPDIRLPCLITTGKYDVVTRKCIQPIHHGIRGSRLVVFKDGSHTPMWESRARFMEIVRSFLDGVKAG